MSKIKKVKQNLINMYNYQICLYNVGIQFETANFGAPQWLF